MSDGFVFNIYTVYRVSLCGVRLVVVEWLVDVDLLPVYLYYICALRIQFSCVVTKKSLSRERIDTSTCCVPS